MRSNWKFLILSSLLALFLAFVPPLENGRLRVSGKVKNHLGERLENVKITVMDSLGRSIIDTIRTNSRGSYGFDLDYHNKYRVYYEKEGYYKVFFSYDTELPLKKELLDYYYSPPSEIMLADSFELNKRAFRKNPITEISFYEYYDQFRQDEDLLRAYLSELIEPNVGVLIVQGKLKTNIDSLKSGVKVYAITASGEILDSSTTDAKGNYEIESPLQEKEVRVSFISPKIHDTYYTVNTQVKDSSEHQEEYYYEHLTDVYPEADSTMNTRAFRIPNHLIAYDSTKSSFAARKPVEDVFVEKLNTPVYDSMKVIGQILAEGTEVFGPTELQVFDKDSNLVSSTVIPEGDSIFDLMIPINKDLRVVYKAPGYHEAFFKVDSRVNDEKLNILNTNVTLFDTLNEAHNPQAFERPTERYFYNNTIDKFDRDLAAEEVFKRVLQSDPEDEVPTGKVILAGTTTDQRGKKIDNVELVFIEDGVEAFTDTSDNKGRYEIDLKLNKQYRMYCKRDGFFEHFMDIDTRVPKSEYAEEFVLEPPIILFDEELTEITNPVGFEQLPFEKLSYSPAEDDFKTSESAFDQLRALVTRLPLDQQEDDTSGVDEIPVYTAENTFLTVKGRIKDMNDKRLKDVQVFLMQENDILQITASDNTGTYELDAPYDKELDVKFTDDDHFEAYIELYTDADSSYKNRELELEDMVLYDRENDKVNAMAFTKPMHRFVFNPVSEILDQDPKVRYEFIDLLETPLDKPLLTLSGRVKKNDGSYMKGVMVYLKKDTLILDSIETDRKGVYQMNVPYNDEYELVFKDEDYHETYIDVDTRTALDEKDLRKESHTAQTVEMFKLKDEQVEETAFENAFAEVNFNPVTGKFRNRISIKQRFLASVFKPRVEEEEILSNENELAFEEIEHEELEGNEKSIEELLSKYKDRAEQHKLAKTRNEIKESRYRMMSSMMINDSADFTKIENVLINSKSINNVLFETQLPNLNRQRDRRDQVADISEGLGRASDIAMAVGNIMRKGAIDTIAIDSVFQVLRDVRIYESGYGGGVREVKRYIVKHAGAKEEYAIITRWFFFDTYLKNKKEIEEEQFLAEMKDLREREKL